MLTGQLLRIGLLTAAGTIGFDLRAEAAIYYWSDSGPGFWQSAVTPAPQRRQPVRRHMDKNKETAEKEATKPQGPLIISISIAQQKMRVYDANGLFAESSVSTGMPGHPTPMGVFSVIQKHRLHHSNIYSGAPMPYMQRITWSGVAIHAGVLPGYPASHGCIRMPTAFAVRMWNWTKLGARVVITPGDVTPVGFSHPLLATLAISPEPIEAEQPKADAGAIATVDKATDETLFSLPRPADNRLPPTGPSVRISDLLRGGAPVAAEQDASEAAKPTEQTKTAARHEAAKIEARAKTEPAKVELDKSDQKPAEGFNPAAPNSMVVPEPGNEQSRPGDVMNAATAKADSISVSKRAGQIAVFVSRKDSKLYVRQNFAPLFDLPITISPDERPLGTHVFTARIDKNDASVLRWSVVSLPAPTRHAVRPLDDIRGLRWRKITGVPPVEARSSPEQDSPTEALDRIQLPADALARITGALSTGASLIVSDQGIMAGETGEGTDFIVTLR